MNLPQFSIGAVAFSGVMLLCTMANLTGMALGLRPPPVRWWIGGWLLTALVAGVVAAHFWERAQ